MKKFITLLLLIPVAVLAATVNLAWNPNAPSDNVTSYRVYEIVSGNPVYLQTVTSTNATLLGVTIANHTYAVSASNAVGESALSLPASVTAAQLTPPPAPTNLRIISVGP